MCMNIRGKEVSVNPLKQQKVPEKKVKETVLKKKKKQEKKTRINEA